MSFQNFLNRSITILRLINFPISSGPLILPEAFLLAGIGFSSLFYPIFVFLSYCAAEMIVETSSNLNAIENIKK
jgi:hypothetical protein